MTQTYCPCGGTCHFSESPCSLGCMAHNADVRHRPMRALDDDATCVCLRPDDHPMHTERFALSEPTATAATKDRAAHWYDRPGGAGITKPLWECWRCGSAVSDREKHNEWHRSVKR